MMDKLRASKIIRDIARRKQIFKKKLLAPPQLAKIIVRKKFLMKRSLPLRQDFRIVMGLDKLKIGLHRKTFLAYNSETSLT